MKKGIVLVVVFIILLPVVISLGNSKIPLVCRDNPVGASVGILNFGVEAKGSVVSLISFGESKSEEGGVYAFVGWVSGTAHLDIFVIIGVANGNAGCSISSLVGYASGLASDDIFSLFGVSNGKAGRDIAVCLGVANGTAGDGIVAGLGVANGTAGGEIAAGLGVAVSNRIATRNITSLIGVALGFAENQEIRGLISIRYLEWNDIRILPFWMNP